MNEQEVFDAASNHLIQQKVPSMDSDGECVYRGKGGLKCAAGIFIPNEKYDPSFEYLIWATVASTLGLFDKHTSFILKLQDLHDRASLEEENYLKELKHLLSKFAKEHNLKFQGEQ
jgi:hypothetical protein